MNIATQLNITIIKSLHLIHHTILFFILFGWIFPHPTILIVHLILIPLTILQWKFNRGTCLLTNIENILLKTKRERTEQQGQFIKGILAKCFDPLPSDQTIKFWLYTIIWGSFAISSVRLLVSINGAD